LVLVEGPDQILDLELRRILRNTEKCPDSGSRKDRGLGQVAGCSLER